ncbi:Protein PhnA [hydrothermal vent metagenome]|uniref:Protein PhnA n=1 Tax=hydrothermal vent metagenome TaxID=652676 RepID=A0A3B1AV60_9ZZZZ
MTDTLRTRSNSNCELCSTSDNLEIYEVLPIANEHYDSRVLLCASCREQIEDPAKTDPHHWRCLNDSMWSQVPAVQVIAWRMLTRLRAEGWPQDLLDMLYLDDALLAWAQASGEESTTDDTIKHLDSNGAQLEAGDTVTLIKDLNVKGANFTAKRGTAVRGISLVADNPAHIEGRINGQQIVILTKFIKKAN